MALTLLPTPPSSLDGTFDNLPPEVLLAIIPRTPYSPYNLSCLCLTCRKLNDVIRYHEHGLVKDIKTHQFRERTLDLFPGLPDNYKGLRLLYERFETLEEVHTHWLKIINHGLELQWLKGRWEHIHKAGLLLLYRLQDAGEYEEKVALMQRLPATSLACLLFKLISSIKILRVYGPEPIKASYIPDDVMVRSDVELAFEELLLQHGPDFFVVMLKDGRPGKTDWAVRYAYCSDQLVRPLTDTHVPRTLRTEFSGMEARQRPHNPATLIASLRRAFAAKAGCEINESVTKMWAILSSNNFDGVGEEKMVAIVQGQELDGGSYRGQDG